MTRQQIKERAKAQLGFKIFGNNWLFAVLALLLISVATGVVSAVTFGIAAIVIIGPIQYAMSFLFLKQARDGQQMDMKDLLSGFTSDFSGNFLLGLLQAIFIWLWSLLFVIPGIVKSYAYSMSFFLKVDHPEYDWKTCLDESRKMMNGHKMDLFIQDLSFIGWMIVGSLCFGVGTLWVSAYMQAARAQFYENLKNAPAIG